MADVTISSLPLGTPSSSALLPYSQGGTTYSARPSAIVAAVLPGSIVQTAVATDSGAYSTSLQTQQPTGLVCAITPKYSNSRIKISVTYFARAQNDRGGIGILRSDGIYVCAYREGLIYEANTSLGPNMKNFQVVDFNNIGTAYRTYTLTFRVHSGAGTVVIGDRGDPFTGPTATMILEELAQ